MSHYGAIDQDARRGFTLIEVVTSVLLISLVFVGIGSAIVISSHALPGGQNVGDDLLRSAEPLQILAQELEGAIHVTNRSATMIALTVPDRNGDGLFEDVRYEWSGMVGQPLTRFYNSGSTVPWVDNVQEFRLDYFLQPRKRSTRVLLVVPNPGELTAQDKRKRDLMRAWGFAVSLISAADKQAGFDLAAAVVDVAYVSEEIVGVNLTTKLNDLGIGVVNEESRLNDELGISSSGFTTKQDTIEIVENTHEITACFSPGPLTICSSEQPLVVTGRTLAGGANILARKPLSHSHTLVVVESGRALYGGGAATGRRVALPWGGRGFDVHSLNNDGLALMARALEWAAGSKVLTRVQITLRTGEEDGSRTGSSVLMLNRPGVAP